LADERLDRRLSAVLAADVAGYSRLVGADEEGTLRRLKSLQADLFLPSFAEHRGRLVKTTGDGLLAEFASVVDAVRCAVHLQRWLVVQNACLEPDKRIDLRIGVHVGDIVVEKDGDILGDGVNVAARLEGLAPPGGICVSARVKEDVEGRLDVAFADQGEQQLKNIVRPVRVYRVVLNAMEDGQNAAPAMAAPAADAADLADRPVIAVLPFQNMSADPEQEFFADGVVEDIISSLAHYRYFDVIARNSTFTYKGRAVDVKQVGRELGARFVLEGSVRKVGQRIRITAQLIDAATANHIWADRVEGMVDDLFELQDQVTASVVGAIEPEMRRAEMKRAVRQPPPISIPTCASCAAWPASTSGAGPASTRRCAWPIRRSSAIPDSARRTPWLSAATSCATPMAGRPTPSATRPKPGGWWSRRGWATAPIP